MISKHSAYWVRSVASAGLVLVLTACASTPQNGDYGPGATAAPSSSDKGVENYVLVDCLLPGQIRRLGTRMTYLTPRRPVKATRRDCEIRGGEYILFDRSDYSSALSSLLPKARGGDPVAQTYVGEIYERGLGLAAPDYGSAAGWYRKAADSGHRPAQTSLGSLYERGLGVPRDKAVALDWYRRASGVTEDRLVFDSTLRAERDAFKKEIALRNQVAGSLRQQLRNTEQKLNRQATEVKSARSVLEDDKRKLERLTGTPQASQSRAEVEQLKSRIKEQQTTLAAHETEVNALQGTYAQEKSLLESQRRDAQSEAERLRSELHAVRELQARERAQEQSTASRAKSAQLGKLELSRKEQYEAVLDTSRRFASTP